MNVKCAKKHIKEITKNCDKIYDFTENHDELADETGFLVDAVAYLSDYKGALERAIEKAEVNI